MRVLKWLKQLTKYMTICYVSDEEEARMLKRAMELMQYEKRNRK